MEIWKFEKLLLYNPLKINVTFLHSHSKLNLALNKTAMSIL